MMNDVYEKFLKSSEEFIFAENKPEKSDIIFVPGNGYPQMAEKAAELFKKGMADWILPSGKYSVVNGKFSGVLEKSNVYNKEYGTEWEFLRDVLIKNGVPDQKILKEDQATFTYENAIYSRQVTDHAELEIERAILCCKSYHARRCLMYYQLLYPKTESNLSTSGFPRRKLKQKNSRNCHLSSISENCFTILESSPVTASIPSSFFLQFSLVIPSAFTGKIRLTQDVAD